MATPTTFQFSLLQIYLKFRRQLTPNYACQMPSSSVSLLTVFKFQALAIHKNDSTHPNIINHGSIMQWNPLVDIRAVEVP